MQAAKWPRESARRAAHAGGAAGRRLHSIKGCHRQYKHPAKPRVTVPGHPGDDVVMGTLNSILKQAGLRTRYLVIYEKTGRGYSADVPGLTGYVATGATMEETERLMREAIAFHIEGLREDGLPIPEPTTTADYITTA